MKTSITEAVSHLKSIAPQFLVDDLEAAISFYRDKLGFTADFIYESFYASVSRDGCTIHLKHASKIASDRTHRKQNEHLDAYFAVEGIEALYREFQSRGASIIKQPETRPWGVIDFYVEDSEGYILCFGQQAHRKYCSASR